MIRVALVEDDRTLSRVLSRELRAVGFDVRAFERAEGVVEAFGEFQPQVALVDLKLPGMSGLDLLRDLKATFDDLQVVMLTGHGGVADAVEAMRRGAYDFLVKPTQLDVLEQTLRRAAEKSDLLLENRRLRRAVESDPGSVTILGSSSAMEEIRRMISRIGPTDASVLITGENGTGKELIARRLHRESARSGRPCVVINCGAVAEDLVESELFGHERGAFTGADRRKTGLFEAADKGTLFLDEIGELPLQVQPALLRALQFGEIRPVGSSTTKTVDVRVIAATNRDLSKEIAQGRFREDLYYRIVAFQIHVAPLRDRPDDAKDLARFFLARITARTGRELVLDEAALRRLAMHDWPGNVRELENVVLRLSVLCPGPVISANDIEEIGLRDARATARADLPTLDISELERLAVMRALERHEGDKKAAAEELGIALRTLYNKISEYGIG